MFFFFYQFVSFAQKHDIEISLEEIKEFEQFLIKHPLMGTKNLTGDKLFEAIRRHKQSGQGFILNKFNDQGDRKKLFRGRNRKSDSASIFTNTEMWVPQSGYSSHGRYNAIGVPVLYLTDDKTAIPYEIHTAYDEEVVIVEFQLERNLTFFDIREFDNEFEGFFENTRIDSRQLKHSYLLPNFVGACCNFLGYDGVKYNGTRSENLYYTNYALFNYKDGEDVSIMGGPISYKQTLVRRLKL